MTIQIVGKDSLFEMANLLGGINSALVNRCIGWIKSFFLADYKLLRTISIHVGDINIEDELLSVETHFQFQNVGSSNHRSHGSQSKTRSEGIGWNL